jgi:hypothetical protein
VLSFLFCSTFPFHSSFLPLFFFLFFLSPPLFVSASFP